MKDTAKELTTTLEIKTAFIGNVVCTKCGQAHSYEGLLNGTQCSNCSEELTKELF